MEAGSGANSSRRTYRLDACASDTISTVVELSTLAAGPIVRRADSTSVSVWLALTQPGEVHLSVEGLDGTQLLAGQASTVDIGEHLHLVLVTATGAEALEWGNTYAYELTINDELLEIAPLLYAGGPEKLSFVLPGSSLEDTHIVHGSCRHPTDRGADALTILDEMVAESFTDQAPRPQVFVCSGDLIYADSPSPSLLAMVGELGDRILGYREVLPGIDCAASEIPLSDRERVCGDIAAIYDPPDRQLFGFGEFLALHLTALSPSLWPADVPADLRRYYDSLASVRRALANTAFYNVFDDHEVTDDWYLPRAWAERVLDAPLGRRMIANGLTAFAIIHAWGNTPAQFEEGEVGARILDRLRGQSQPTSEMEADLGMPTAVGDELSPSANSLPWHFRLQTPVVDLRTLDPRTMRAFPLEDEHGLPDLLSARALVEQLSDLQGLPVLVVPSPMAPPPRTKSERFFVQVFGFIKLLPPIVRKVYRPDRGDDWQPTSELFERILEILPKRWVCLGGDTHLAYGAEVAYGAGAKKAGGRGAIFCSSGMQRETTLRLMRQRLGFGYPWPLPRRPVIKSASMTMRYLQSEETEGGKRLQYVSRNHIGRLHFAADERGLLVVHRLWWRRKDGSLTPVEHRVSLEDSRVDTEISRTLASKPVV